MKKLAQAVLTPKKKFPRMKTFFNM